MTRRLAGHVVEGTNVLTQPIVGCYVVRRSFILPSGTRLVPQIIYRRIQTDVDSTTKQMQFNRAMELYTTRRRYRLFGQLIAAANVSLQLYLLYRVLPYSVGVAGQIAAFSVAILLADFINGLVHMYMDGNDDYLSPAGPLIANFHLHHKVPLYRKSNVLLVYFNESGSKVWLVPCLLALAIGLPQLSPLAALILVYTGILSSYAEVSHYLCHTSTSRLTLLLSRLGIVLTKRHHAGHHLEDNRNYAFLNGITDPLLNLLAVRIHGGYKRTTDTHYERYAMASQEER